MKSLYGGYEISNFEGAYGFAGANTAHGFCGLYDELANERTLNRLYIIKGGAGTGKSTLMRTVGETARELGANVQYYLCGSDPDSVDCAVLDRKIAILDGTAPHNCDMLCPGASSSLVDLSKFWDCDYLEKRRDEIAHLCAEKRSIIESVYRYMRAAEIAERERSCAATRIFDTEKAEKYITRLMGRIGKPLYNETGRVSPRYNRSVSMRGCFYVPIFEKCAETVYTAVDCKDCAPLFMSLLSDKLTGAGYDTEVSRMPITGQPDGIFVISKKIAFVASDKCAGDNDIRMTRFVSDDLPDGVRGSMRLSERLYTSCVDEAVTLLKRAAEAHFALEKLYGEAMDFSKLERYTKTLCKEITSRI